MIDFSRIVNIRTLRSRVDEAIAKAEEAERPVLLDWSLIPTVYSHFVDYVNDREQNPDDFTKRRQFTFIALYLFAPKALIGGKMPVGMRDRLCDVLGINTGSALSNQVKDLVFFYQEYKDFRDGVNDAYAYIEQCLGLTGCDELNG